jgi:SEC-C motif domain protein
MSSRECPCGTGQSYDECCGPIHAGTAAASTAEKLMRSRYSAFAVGDADYLLRSWHSSTRPPSVRLETGQRWTGLEIVATTGGGMLHAEGTVEFRAHYRHHKQRGVLHERSRFTREDGQWRYLDGVTP